MWQRFGDIKNNLGELTNKALTSAAKAGSRAKEILNQVDNEELLENEINNSPSNLLNDSEVKSRDKSRDFRQTGKGFELESDNRYKDIFSAGDATGASSILNDSNLTKTLSWKEEKRYDMSPTQTRQTPSVDASNKLVTKSLDGFNFGGQDKKQSEKRFSKEPIEPRSEVIKKEIQTGTFEDRQQQIQNSVRKCVEQYREEISRSIIEELNANILKQIAAQEEGIYEDVKGLLSSWINNSNLMQSTSHDVLPEEKLINLFSDNTLLREEIALYKNQNDKFQFEALENAEIIKQLQAQLENEKNSSKSYEESIQENFKKSTQDSAGLERKVKNLEDELNEYKAMLQERYDDIQRLDQAVGEKDAKLKSVESQLKAELLAKEDLRQQYEGLVPGMKEFEEAMSQINQENERLSSEYESMKSQLAQERKKVKDVENSISVDIKDRLLEKLSRLNALTIDLEIESLINSKIIYKEGRVAAGSFLEALEQSLAQILGMVNKKFDSQLQEDKGKERGKYQILSKDYDRMQGELKEALKREKEILNTREDLRRENIQLTDIVENLNSLGAQHANRIKDLQKANNELKDAQKKYKDEIRAKNEEIDQLKTKYNMLVEEANQALDSAAKVEVENELIPELNSRLENLAIEVGNLNDVIRMKNDENERLHTTIMNLQAVIDDSQSLQENTMGQYVTEIKKLRSDLDQVSRKSQILQEYKEKFETLEKEFIDRDNRVKDLNIRLKESEQEKNAIKAEAAALLKKAKSEATYKEHLVDKRVITSFLMKYFDFNATFAVKLGVLETMSSILGFTEDERIKLGLPRQGPGVQETIAAKPKLESPLVQKTELKIEEEKSDKKEVTTQPKKSISEADDQKNVENKGVESQNEKKEEKEPEKPQSQQKSFKQMFMSFLNE